MVQLASGRLEYFADGPNAAVFAPAIEATAELIVPSLTLHEVVKRTLQQRDEGTALQIIAAMQQGRVVDLDASLALIAAKLSVDLGLPLVDSVILATARTHQATLWTQDADFKGLACVEYRAHQ